MPSKVPFIENNLCGDNFLFVGLSETWLKSQLEAELKIDGYTLFRCDTAKNRNLEVDTPVELAFMYEMILDVHVTLYSLILQKAFK